ncbi:MAG TPA: hypothetical protein VIL00_16670 [Pseudonocardiaceae bacterium]
MTTPMQPGGATPPAQPNPNQPNPNQPVPGQPVPGQPVAGGPFPGQPGAGGPFPGQPAPAAQPPAKKKSVVRVIVSVAAAILVLVVGFVSSLNDPRQAEVGDCARITGPRDDPEYTKLDCSDNEAIYQVAKVLDDSDAECPEGEYDELVMEETRGSGYKLCLMPNLSEGDCISEGKDEDGPSVVKGNCDASGALRVAKVIKGQNDSSLCLAEEAIVLSYAEPPVTYCLKEA